MSDKLITWLTGELRTRGWSHRELARRASLSQTAISTVLSGERLPGWDFCAAIARPLEVTPEDVLRLAGLLPNLLGPSDDLLIRQLSERFNQLSFDRRQRVLEFVKFEYQQQSQEKEQLQNKQSGLVNDALGNAT